MARLSISTPLLWALLAFCLLVLAGAAFMAWSWLHGTPLQPVPVATATQA